jgi:hypothetical protein
MKSRPPPAKSLLALLSTLQSRDEDFPAIHELPYEPDLTIENWLRSEEDD